MPASALAQRIMLKATIIQLWEEFDVAVAWRFKPRTTRREALLASRASISASNAVTIELADSHPALETRDTGGSIPRTLHDGVLASWTKGWKCRRRVSAYPPARGASLQSDGLRIVAFLLLPSSLRQPQPLSPVPISKQQGVGHS